MVAKQNINNNRHLALSVSPLEAETVMWDEKTKTSKGEMIP
jgi:hypothetical protein